MNEDFYTPSTPQPRQPRSRSRGLGTTTYQFRQPQTRINPLALRRLELQNVESQRREEIAAGNQELAAVKEMAHLEQQEFAIRQGIIKEKQVASAQREVAKLDPLSDPQYASKYAEVMSRHPMAQDNKFLNESFTDGSKVNYRAAQHKFNELEEGQKQAGKEELEWIKASSAYATSGGDPSAFTDKDGQHDWNALNAARAKAALVTKAAAEKDNAGLPILKTVTKEGDTTVTREAPKPAKPELTEAQKIAQAKLEGTLTGQLHQQEIFQKQMSDPDAEVQKQAKKNHDAISANIALTQAQVDAVHGVTNPVPSVPVAPAPVVSSATPPPPTTPPTKTAAGASDPKDEFNTKWDQLTQQMSDSQTQADAHRKVRDAADAKISSPGYNGFFHPLKYGKDIDESTAASNAANDLVQQHEQAYHDAYTQRQAMLESRIASIPDARKTSQTVTPPKPPITDLVPFN